jgi:hypothetical protein
MARMDGQNTPNDIERGTMVARRYPLAIGLAEGGKVQSGRSGVWQPVLFHGAIILMAFPARAMVAPLR